MFSKHELQNIISGNATVRHGKIIQTIANFLRKEKRAIQETQEGEFLKDQETKILIELIAEKKLWINAIDESKYIGEGAEKRFMSILIQNI